MIKFLFALLAFIICGWPTWLYLIVRSLLEPHGFWQELVLGVVGVYFLVAFQILFVFIFLGAIIAILKE